MELEKSLVDRYGLDRTKQWKIKDRLQNLILLDGFYQGTIIDLDVDSTDGIYDFYQFQVEEITDKIKLQKLSGKKLYLLPDGVLYKVWTYRGTKFYSTKDKIDNPLIFTSMEQERNLEDGYYIVSFEGLSLTYRKSLSGIFRLLDGVNLPEATITEADKWLGTDEKTSDGEFIYAVDETGPVIYKPVSKKWRELIVHSVVYPNQLFFGLYVDEDLLTRWIALSSSAKLTDETYSQFWIQLYPDISTPHKKLINTYACFLSALYQGPINIYEEWYGVAFPEEYDSQLENIPQNAVFPQLKAPATLNELVLYIWSLIQQDSKKVQKYKRIINNSPADPWNAFLDLFRVTGLEGFEINRLRKL